MEIHKAQSIFHTQLTAPTYWKNYINQNASLSERTPNKQEVDIIAGGISIAACVSAIEPAFSRPYLTEMDRTSLAINLMSFRLDKNLETKKYNKNNSPEWSKYYLLNNTWSRGYYPQEILTMLNRHLQALEILVHNITIGAIRKAGYFKMRDAIDLFEEIRSVQSRYPNQPVYVLPSGNSGRMSMTREDSLARENVIFCNNGFITGNARGSQLYLPGGLNLATSFMQIMDNSVKIIGKDINPTNLTTGNARSDMPYNTQSAVIAANQIRFNCSFGEQVSVIETAPHQIEIANDMDLAIEIDQYSTISEEDPEKKWVDYISRPNQGRFSNIEV